MEQITWKPQGKMGKDEETQLTEIGPRFVLQPIRIFEGSFGGPTLYENSEYVPPNAVRGSIFLIALRFSLCTASCHGPR